MYDNLRKLLIEDVMSYNDEILGEAHIDDIIEDHKNRDVDGYKKKAVDNTFMSASPKLVGKKPGLHSEELGYKNFNAELTGIDNLSHTPLKFSKKKGYNEGLPYFGRPNQEDESRYFVPEKRSGLGLVAAYRAKENLIDLGLVPTDQKSKAISKNISYGQNVENDITQYIREFCCDENAVDHAEWPTHAQIVDLCRKREVTLEEYENAVAEFALSNGLQNLPDIIEKYEPLIKKAAKMKDNPFRDDAKKSRAEKLSTLMRPETLDRFLRYLICCYLSDEKGIKISKKNENAQHLVDNIMEKVKRTARLFNQYSIPMLQGKYASDIYASFSKLRYGVRTLFWPESFWNEK